MAPGLLACPGCRRLLHADALRALAATAQAHAQAGERGAEYSTWLKVRALLPADTAQVEKINRRLATLADAAPPPETAPAAPAADPQKQRRWLGAASGFGALALLAISKGKLLFLGLSKASTFFSLLLFLGVYWAAWGWRFALGLVLSLYAHELGHVAELRRYGIAASAPVFIPGIGALVRLRQPIEDAGQDARVGLAGPLWGAVAALCCFGVAAATGAPVLGAVGRSGAWLNIFNLLPLWQLDGGRAFKPLSGDQRMLLLFGLALLYLLSGEGLLLLLGGGALLQVLRPAPAQGDREALIFYAVLVLALVGMLRIPVTLPPGTPLPVGAAVAPG